jgi:hypothetical protein
MSFRSALTAWKNYSVQEFKIATQEFYAPLTALKTGQSLKEVDAGLEKASQANMKQWIESSRQP